MDPIPQGENGTRGPIDGPPCTSQPEVSQGLQVMTMSEFGAFKEKMGLIAGTSAKPQVMMVGYVTGFSSNIKSCYNKSAVTRLSYNGLLALDGDAFDASGYTGIIPDFLMQPPDRNKPPRKVVVFLLAHQVEARDSWKQIGADFPGRVFVCIVDLDKDVEPSVYQELSRVKALCKASQDAYLLSRTVIKATKAKRVLALGGDSVVAHVAEATVMENVPKYLQVKWVVFALGRGRREQSRSVANWASETKSPLMDCFKRGLDKDESLAFADLSPGEQGEEALVAEVASPKADPPTEPSVEVPVPANLARLSHAVGQLEGTPAACSVEPADAGLRDTVAEADPPAKPLAGVPIPASFARHADVVEPLEESQAARPIESSDPSKQATVAFAGPPVESVVEVPILNSPAGPADAGNPQEESEDSCPVEFGDANLRANPEKLADTAEELEGAQALHSLNSADASIVDTAAKAEVSEMPAIVPSKTASTSPAVYAPPAVYAAPPPVISTPPSVPTAASHQQGKFEKVQPILSELSMTASGARSSDGHAPSQQSSPQRCCLTDPLLFLRVPRHGNREGKLAPPFLAGWGGA